VIDEQHKFGVMQRARLRGRDRSRCAGDDRHADPAHADDDALRRLDVSTLDELPPTAANHHRRARRFEAPDAVEFIRKQLLAGRQGYIVYP
jgi:ATP-dependent DNA helicase RecG